MKHGRVKENRFRLAAVSALSLGALVASPTFASATPMVPSAQSTPALVTPSSDQVEIHPAEVQTLAPGEARRVAPPIQSQVIDPDSVESTIRTIISDGSVRSLEYPLDIPEGATLKKVGKAVVAEGADGAILAGFTPSTLTLADGRQLSSELRVEDGEVVQNLPQGLDAAAYPMAAGTPFSGGIIKMVDWERWNSQKRGYELRFTVTALAYATQPINPAGVYKQGMYDLTRYYPRSMAAPTMSQQWDCHVAGLLGVIHVDLESYRRALPDWRVKIAPALIKGKPETACNW